jgi:hypothetical protein
LTPRKNSKLIVTERYSEAVDKDDDILTQFVEAKELKQRIASAKSFQELVEVYNWMKTDHTDEG